MRGGAALLMLGVMGIILIWKGFTGNVLRTRMGDAILPRWAYVFGEMVLILFPAVAYFFIFDK